MKTPNDLNLDPQTTTYKVIPMCLSCFKGDTERQSILYFT